MRAFVKGMLARSKAGHDTGKLFVVMQAEEEFVYLADGRCRTLDKQKKREESTFRLFTEYPPFFRKKWKKAKNCGMKISEKPLKIMKRISRRFNLCQRQTLLK